MRVTQPPPQTQNIPQSTLRKEKKKTLYCKGHLSKAKPNFEEFSIKVTKKGMPVWLTASNVTFPLLVFTPLCNSPPLERGQDLRLASNQQDMAKWTMSLHDFVMLHGKVVRCHAWITLCYIRLHLASRFMLFPSSTALEEASCHSVNCLRKGPHDRELWGCI